MKLVTAEKRLKDRADRNKTIVYQAQEDIVEEECRYLIEQKYNETYNRVHKEEI